MSATADTAIASFAAIGTTAVLKVTDASALEWGRTILERDIESLDRTCSRFRPDSDLMRVNRGTGRWTAVDPMLVDALEVALRAAELTDGDVDPTLGRALVLAGYDRDWDLLEHPGDDGPQIEPQDEYREARPPQAHARAHSGWRTVQLDRERLRIRLPAGIQLDLGATAKAWAADRASEAIHRATGSGVLVSLGGDIATAGDAPAHGWRIHVTDDHRDGEHAPGQTVSIRSGGLATSSIAVRRWKQGEATMHHIIDPATGGPANGPWRTVSVAARSCTDANIATTAALVRGLGAHRWLEGLGLPARLADRSGNAITIGDWPPEHSGAGKPVGEVSR
jgi:thiamine biosynthesis lipoprotein ApbE